MNLAFGQESVTAVTSMGRYVADKAIVTTGAWIADFLPPQRRALVSVTRQVVYWFEVEDPGLFTTDRFPGILWGGDRTEDYFSAFPMPPNGTPGMKVLTEQFDVTTTADTVSRAVTSAEIAHFYENFVSQKMTGVIPNCIKAAVCLYTNTPDDHFIVDFHPDSTRTIIASPCSGHGFKHSAALGEAMTQLALTGQSSLDLAPFGLARLQ